MLDEKLTRYEELEQMMTDPEVLSNSSKLAAVAREHGRLAKLATLYRSFKLMLDEIAELNEMASSDDPDEKELASSELPEIKERREVAWNDLLEMTIGGDDASRNRCVMEIRAGTGGDEAALFAENLFRMYARFCEIKKWKYEIISLNENEGGGVKEVVFSVNGDSVYGILKYESGVHRVQRVPETETQGRVHTSAATVAVLPEAEEVDVKIEDKDLRIDVFRSSGPGGQSVNTTDSAVRITHIPTGIVVSQQDEKSQIRNKEKGLKILRSRIYELERKKKEDERSKYRKSKIGTGDRSERIRTYNFPQGRVTDHRINLTLHKLAEFMEGEIFDEMIENLNLQAQQEKLENLN